MRVVFSRKGFDTANGGAPSPIIEGRPVSLPIPTKHRSATTYEQLGLGNLVERATRGRIGRDTLCHDDPLFAGGRCLFGQCGSAQSHLAKRGVGVGDVFLFFGLFAQEGIGEKHHRIYGYMSVESVIPMPASLPEWEGRKHPHTIGAWNKNNTVYAGEGSVAPKDWPELRLTKIEGPLNHWRVPPWLEKVGLTYHNDPARWLSDNILISTSPGQEFVADIGNNSEGHQWLEKILELIKP